MAKTIIKIGVVLALVLFATAIAPACAVNSITVNPGLINVGETTVITLTLEQAATGKLVVTYNPTNVSWFAILDINIPSGGGSQSWTFPTDFQSGANTNGIGDYQVNATIDWIPPGHFKVEFFVIPDLPFGTLMATVGCFGAVGGYAKLRRKRVDY
jgi:hypothetical protein